MENKKYDLTINGQNVTCYTKWGAEKVKEYEEYLNSYIPSIYNNTFEMDVNLATDEIISNWGWESKSLQQSPRSIKLKQRRENEP